MRNVRLKYFVTLQVLILALTGCAAIGLGPAKVRIAEITITTDKPDAEVYRVDQDGNMEKLGTTDHDGYYTTEDELYWKEGLYRIEVVDKDSYSWTPQIDVKGRDLRIEGSTIFSITRIPNTTFVHIIIKKCNEKSIYIYRINGEERLIGISEDYYYEKHTQWDEGDYRIKITKNGFNPWISSKKWGVRGRNSTIKIPEVILEPKN